MKNGTVTLPPLTDGSEALVPRFSIGTRIIGPGTKFDSPKVLGQRAQKPLEVGAPTLAQLRYAYFGRKADDEPICPELRSNVWDSRYGEWVNCLVLDGKKVILGPRGLSYDNSSWEIVGGEPIDVELPYHGWVLEFDPYTGLPSRTGSETEAKGLFGRDASFWYRPGTGLRALYRVTRGSEWGPFCINHTDRLDRKFPGIGYRPSWEEQPSE